MWRGGGAGWASCNCCLLQGVTAVSCRVTIIFTTKRLGDTFGFTWTGDEILAGVSNLRLAARSSGWLWMQPNKKS